MTTVTIRPEQARHLIQLHNESRAAQIRFHDAARVALMGLVAGEAVIDKIYEDGTVSLIVAQQEEPDGDTDAR